MFSTTVTWSTIEDVKKFVDIANKYMFDIDLSLGRYVVNAKSLMGVFCLDLCERINLVADCAKDSPFVQEIQNFVI